MIAFVFVHHPELAIQPKGFKRVEEPDGTKVEEGAPAQRHIQGGDPVHDGNRRGLERLGGQSFEGGAAGYREAIPSVSVWSSDGAEQVRGGGGSVPPVLRRPRMSPELFDFPAAQRQDGDAQLHQYFTPEWAALELVAEYFPSLRSDDVVIEPSCGRGTFLKGIPEDGARDRCRD